MKQLNLTVIKFLDFSLYNIVLNYLFPLVILIIYSLYYILFICFSYLLICVCVYYFLTWFLTYMLLCYLCGYV
jgi:hypothetical protein